MNQYEEQIEEVTKAMCMAMYGGYPAYRQDREKWPQWYWARRGAIAAIHAVHYGRGVTASDPLHSQQ